MTTTRVYRSTDAGAPVLSGALGSLLNLLDKCLVDGYGSKTAAGWVRSYTGANKTTYRNSLAAGGTGMHLRVDDSGGSVGGAREALCRAYLTMSDIDTGTIETPTTAQVAALVWRKSNTADSAARPWVVVADERTVYVCVDTGTHASENGAALFGAGDIASDVPADAYGFFLCGRESGAGAGDMGGDHGGLITRAGSGCATPGAEGIWIARGHAGIGSPIRAAVACLAAVANYIGASLAGSIAGPAPGSLLQLWTPALIASEGSIRGRLRGAYAAMNALDSAIGAVVTDPPGLGASLVAMPHMVAGNGSASYRGMLHLSTASWS